MSSATLHLAYPARMDQKLPRWLWLVKWLITLLVLISAVALLFTGRYPPFRLDMGEHEPGEPEPGGA